MAQKSDLQILVVRLEAQMTKFEKDMKKAGLVADQTAVGMEKSFRRTETRMMATGRRSGDSFLKGFKGGLGVGGRGGVPAFIGSLIAAASVDAIREAADAGDKSAQAFVSKWKDPVERLGRSLGNAFTTDMTMLPTLKNTARELDTILTNAISLDNWMKAHWGFGFGLADKLGPLGDPDKMAKFRRENMEAFRPSPGAGTLVTTLFPKVDKFKENPVELSEDLTKAMEEYVATMDEARLATRGFLGDLISGLRQGVSLTDSLGQAFANLADTMLDKVLDQAVDQMLGGAGTPGMGLLGQLLGLGGGKDQSRITPDVFGPAAPVESVLKLFKSGKGPHLGGINIPGAGLSSGMVGGDKLAGVPFSSLIQEAAAKHGLDPALLAAVVKQESRFNPNAVSPAGAMGLTQLMPGTARDLGVADAFDPRQNIFGGADYLAQMLKLSGGSVPGALARYNAGPKGGADMSSLPAETLDYIPKVLEFFKLFAGMRAEGGPVARGGAYVVGEKGPELFMPRTPGIIAPNGGAGGNVGGLAVQVLPSRYFDVRVARTAGRLDAGVLRTGSRSMPGRMASFSKLGT